MRDTLESCLTNEIVYVKFYKRKKGNSTIDNPKHVANGGMLENATKTYVVPRLRNGLYKNILTDDEKDYLEEVLRLPKGDLSIYNKDYWDKRKVVLGKENNEFSLSDPEQYIDYKILVANSNSIAPSLDVILNKATYVFYIEKEGDEEKRKVKKISIKQEAYKLFGKYENNREALRFILKEAGKPTAKNTKDSSLQAWISDLIESTPTTFVKIAGDKLLLTKMFLELAVDYGILKYKDKKYYDKETNKALAETGKVATLENAAIYLNKPRQQEYRLSLEAKIKTLN